MPDSTAYLMCSHARLDCIPDVQPCLTRHQSLHLTTDDTDTHCYCHSTGAATELRHWYLSVPHQDCYPLCTLSTSTPGCLSFSAPLPTPCSPSLLAFSSPAPQQLWRSASFLPALLLQQSHVNSFQCTMLEIFLSSCPVAHVVLSSNSLL